MFGGSNAGFNTGGGWNTAGGGSGAHRYTYKPPVYEPKGGPSLVTFKAPEPRAVG
jgi:hypothetical protein